MMILPEERAVSWRFGLSSRRWTQASAVCACHRTSLEGRGRFCRRCALATQERSGRFCFFKVFYGMDFAFASVFLSSNLLWYYESFAFYLVGQAGTRWDRESGAVSCKNDWLHLKSNKSFALDVQISYPAIYCRSSPRSGNRGARAWRGVLTLLCSSTSAAFTTWST